MKQLTRLFALLLIASLGSPACSLLTAEGRRERAYNHYVQKYSRARFKQQRRLSLIRAKVPRYEPSEPSENTQVSGPESVTASSSSNDGGRSAAEGGGD